METGYPIFIGKYFKPAQIGLFQMPALSFYKKKLRLSWLRAAKFFSMQIIEFPSATQRQAFTSPSMKYM